MTYLGFIILFLSQFTALSMVYVLGNFLFKGDLKQWLTARRERIEARNAEEHKRKVELAEAGTKNLEVVFAGMLAMLEKHQELKSSRPPRPPGGIVHPKPAGPEGIGIERGEFFVSRNQPKPAGPEGIIVERIKNFVSRNQPKP